MTRHLAPALVVVALFCGCDTQAPKESTTSATGASSAATVVPDATAAPALKAPEGFPTVIDRLEESKDRRAPVKPKSKPKSKSAPKAQPGESGARELRKKSGSGRATGKESDRFGDLFQGSSGSGSGARSNGGGEGVRMASALSASTIYEGGLKGATVRRFVAGKREVFDFCIERARRTTPALAGVAWLRVRIEANGRTSDAQMESSSLGHKEADACLLRAAKRLKFPRAKASSRHSFKVVFAAPKAKG